MFENLRAMGAVADLLKNKDKIKAAVERVQAKGGQIRVEGEAGNGAARATVDGLGKVLSVDLMPALVMGMAADERTRGLAGDLIAQAVNDANARSRAAMRVEIEKELREMGLEGMADDVVKMMGR